MGEPAVSHELLSQISRRLKALADPMRLRILHALAGGRLCVGDIVERVGGSQANVSKHLSVLRGAGMVCAEREGMYVFYELDDPAAFEVCRLVYDSLERQTTEQLAELERSAAALGGRRRR